MELKSLIDTFLEKEYDDKIYFTIIDRETGRIVVENKRLFSSEFEPYHDSMIFSIVELSPAYHYLISVYKWNNHIKRF